MRLMLLLVLAVTFIVAAIAAPREDVLLEKIGVNKTLKVRRGLDLQGGAYLVYEADMTQLPQGSNSGQVLNNAKAIIERRVNPGGGGEAIVQTGNGNRIIVQIPGIDDPEAAKQTIGRTAQLNFYEVSGGEGGSQLTPTDVSGKDVDKATAGANAQTGKPEVTLNFRGGESTTKFAQLTERLSGSSSQLVTVLDDQIVFGPANTEPIPNGQAQLSGNFDLKGAKEIATLLNAGALPVPISLVAQQTIGPTLGALSIKQSVVAAAIGLLCVSLFLIIYYRLAGLASVGSLVFYTLLMITVIKLSALTPYTMVLTLAGIAGFILSIAVVVDANILILERVKEEMLRGSSSVLAFEDGFVHAWTSIRDANAATAISCIILYNFGTAIIKGFALTLGVGVVLSLLTALVVSKLLLRLLVRSHWASSPSWINLPRRASQ